MLFSFSFAFATRSSAVILENWSTNNHSVQPVPASVTSNMSKNFDISVYNANVAAQNSSNIASANALPASNPQTNATQTNPANSANNLWYWFIIVLLAVVGGIIFWNIKKEK